MDVSRPSIKLIVALEFTTRLTSKGVVASGLGCNVNTLLLLKMPNRGIAVVFVVGVDIAILGVDIAILCVDIAILGVDIAILGVDIAIIGVEIAIRRKKKGEQKQPKNWGLRGREEGVVSCVRHLEAGWSVR